MNRRNFSENSEQIPFNFDVADAHRSAEDAGHPAGSTVRKSFQRLDGAEEPRSMIDLMHAAADREDVLRGYGATKDRIRADYSKKIGPLILRLAKKGHSIEGIFQEPDPFIPSTMQQWAQRTYESSFDDDGSRDLDARERQYKD